ncbi:MAG TPA: hypothetical protein VKA67_02460, partial [Verrucomicrobiae bacterium]|nr:hypothetical protein [Verrucomicrobiae bacterium]
ETIDAFDLSIAHHIKSTDVGGNLHFETASLNDSHNITFWPGEPIQQKVTDQQDASSYDLFSVNAFSETWINPKLFFSSGFLYSHFNSDFSGSRIYGNGFDVPYAPNPLQTGIGYTNMYGSLCQNDYVMNLNLMVKLAKDLTLVPSIRVQEIDWNADSAGWGTLSTFPSQSFTANSDRCVLDVTEGLNLRYTGVTNWVFYTRGLWTEGQGNLNENGGLSQVAGFGVPPVQFQTDDSRFLQKYAAGARWYPLRATTVDFGGYYKNHHYDYNFGQDNTPNNAGNPYTYPGYLRMQDLQTYDGNIRLTLRLPRNISLTTRYEYQYSTIDTEPDPVSGLGKTQSANITSHIVALNASWVPWSRLYLQPGFNYVWSETTTPASDFVPTSPPLTGAPVLTAQNSYWTADLTTGFVVDDRTDL